MAANTAGKLTNNASALKAIIGSFQAEKAMDQSSDDTAADNSFEVFDDDLAEDRAETAA